MISAREHEQQRVGRPGDSVRAARVETDGNPSLACEYCRRCALFLSPNPRLPPSFHLLDIMIILSSNRSTSALILLIIEEKQNGTSSWHRDVFTISWILIYVVAAIGKFPSALFVQKPGRTVHILLCA